MSLRPGWRTAHSWHQTAPRTGWGQLIVPGVLCRGSRRGVRWSSGRSSTCSSDFEPKPGGHGRPRIDAAPTSLPPPLLPPRPFMWGPWAEGHPVQPSQWRSLAGEGGAAARAGGGGEAGSAGGWQPLRRDRRRMAPGTELNGTQRRFNKEWFIRKFLLRVFVPRAECVLCWALGWGVRRAPW